MRNTGNEILKKTLLHYINLEYYANSLDEEFQTLLEKLQERCNKAIESQKTISTKASYTVVYRIIKEEVDKFQKELEERFEEQAELIMNQETEFLDGLYNEPTEKNTEEKGESTNSVALTFSGVTLAKILFSPIGGRDTAKQFAERTGKNILRSYDTPLRAGYLFGQKSEEVTAQVSNQMKQVARGMQSGIRTAIPSFAKTTDRIVFLNNNVEVVWVATLDGRTCITCASLSGLHFKSISEAPSVPHCLCRCILFPTKDLKEPVPDFEEFIEMLNDDEQELVLRKNRFDLYKKGYVTPKQFLNNGTVISAEELKKSVQIDTIPKRTVYTSNTGGSITALYNKITNEEARNINALKVFANEGEKVLLLQTSNLKGVKTVDSKIGDKFWEIKTITKDAKDLRAATSYAIKRGVKQGSRIIINYEVPIEEKFMKACIEDRVRQHNRIIEIAVEFNGQDKTVYSRREIMDWYKDKEIKEIIDGFKKNKS